MSSFPDDIIVSIFSKLPVKDISRSKSVCKSWCKLFSDSHFVKMHLNHSIQNKNFNLMITGPKHVHLVDDCYDSLTSSPACYQEQVSVTNYPFDSSFDSSERIQSLGSYNGLCCMFFNGDTICFWNPSTKQYKEVLIPLPINIKSLQHVRPYHLFWRYGFGYDKGVDDYKLVKIKEADYIYRKGFKVDVYSLLSDSWKSISNLPSFLCDVSCTGRAPGVFVDGVIHWMMYCRREYCETLISFDLSNETLGETPKPKCFVDNKLRLQTMSTLEGQLCLLAASQGNERTLDVWVVKDYRLGESWTLLFTINTSFFRHVRGSKAVQVLNNGEVLFEKDNSALVLYDPNSERARITKIRGVRKKFSAEIYMPSLVSPNLKKNPDV